MSDLVRDGWSRWRLDRVSLVAIRDREFRFLATGPNQAAGDR
jgi:hypothetical protein